VGDSFVNACMQGSAFGGIDFRWPCVAAAPVPLNGSLTLARISRIDDDATCGIDAAGAAWCWTIWPFVDLPSDTTSVVPGAYPLRCGTETCDRQPRRVRQHFTYKSFDYGRYHGCALTVAGVAYCLGSDQGYGSLGNNSPVYARSDTLVPVSGGITFTQLAVSEGGSHTCGLATAGQAYCWGSGGAGQLGTGASVYRQPVPALVAGGLTFVQLTAGADFTCGLRPTGLAYCWGNGNTGEFGNGGRSNAYSPVLAASGKTFTAITAGGSHACGLAAAGDAWCWGADTLSQLGDGGAAPYCAVSGAAERCSVYPVLVLGGVKFKALDAGLNHTCGISMADEVWCWGDNWLGQLGLGYKASRYPSGTPAKIGG
jgi:alpha-tubulin suppressor-like RCC1 family protein